MKIFCSSNNRSLTNRADTNPCLHIQDLPKNTKSIVVIAESPETRKYHWVVYNIPVTDIIDENFKSGIEAVNDFSQHAFVGPETIEQDPRLIFVTYALDDFLIIGGGKGGHDILNAMRGHILDSAGVECRYENVTRSGFTSNQRVPSGLRG